MTEDPPPTVDDAPVDDEEVPLTFESLFDAYANFNTTCFDEADSIGILLSQIDVWLKQGNLLGENISLTETGMLFNTFRKRRIDIDDFEKFLTELCNQKQLNFDEVKEKLVGAGLPSVATQVFQ